MSWNKILFLPVLFLVTSFSYSQNLSIEGYTYEENNRGFLRNVKISVINKATTKLVTETKTNKEGAFSITVPIGQEYTLVAYKKNFFQKTQMVSTKNQKDGAKVFLKMEMARKPGYIFDVTLAKSGGPDAVVDAIKGAQIEIYNNTTGQQELLLKDYPLPNFKYTFEQGNHYTMMIRKKGFFTKRVEAYVNVEGCILCFEGLGEIEPNVTDVMTNDNTLGTFLSNIEMEPVVLNRSYRIENIYYDFDKWFIRPDAAKELDNLIAVMNDNPSLVFELGSHTDSRGGDAYNMQLSEKRAKAAVDYILDQGIYPDRISSKGYGETVIINQCVNGVKCSNRDHERNRRTEFKVVAINEEDPLADKTLKQIIEEEKLLKEVMNQVPVKIGKKN